MSFIQNAGYLPESIESLMDLVMEGINTQFGTSYTTDTFLGTNWYKYFYALIQLLQQNEVKTAEIIDQLQQYFSVTNEMILRPNTTPPGIIDFMASKGYLVSVKPPIDADAGKAYICVDVDSDAPDYAQQKINICNYIKDCVVLGVITQGDQSETITLSNNQSFDFKFSLPTEIPVKLRLTTTLSENNLAAVSSPEVQKQLLYDNITARYRLGKDFEPERYIGVNDLPWAAVVLLEWSDDAGANWHDEVYEADFDEIFTFELSDISLVED